MFNRLPPQIDVLPDGSYREVPVRGPSLLTQVGRYALVVAVLAGVIALASLAFWLAISLIPIAIGAGLVAWAAFRFRIWQMSRGVVFIPRPAGHLPALGRTPPLAAYRSGAARPARSAS